MARVWRLKHWTMELLLTETDITCLRFKAGKTKKERPSSAEDVTDRLNAVRIGNEEVDHTFSSAHRSYNDRAQAITDQFVRDAKKAGVNPSGLSGKDAREFADKLVKELEGDTYISRFNKMVEEGRGTATALNAMRDAALAEGILKETGLLSGVGKVSRWVARKSGIVAEHLPGALKVLGVGAAVAEFSSDAQAKGVKEAGRTQYYRFSDLLGQTPEEDQAMRQKASNSFFKKLTGDTDEQQ